MAKKKAAKKKAPAKKWAKSSPALKDAFAAALDTLPENAIERRQMFGYPAAFVNDNMCCGLHEENCIVRIGEAARDDAIANHGAGYFGPSGRRVREYAALPTEITSNQRQLNKWVQQAFEFTAAMPPKVKKPKKKTAK